MKRAAIYTRISNDPQGKAAGVERQARECRELVTSRGWSVVEPVFEDNDVRATARSRPAFDALVAAIGRGEVDLVVSWHDDRLLRGGRSKRAHDFLTLVRDRRVNCVFVTADDWDLTTAQGRLMLEIRLGLSAYEIERASERQEARWRQRKRDGKLITLGRRPFGLKRKGDGLVIVPKEANAIRRAARDLIAGASLYAVSRSLPPTPYANRWAPQHAKRMLTGDALVRYGILDEDTHRLVVARLRSKPKRGPGRPPREYALSGLAVCGLCESKLSAGSGAYRCQECGKVGVLAKYLEETVSGLLEDRLPPPLDASDTPAPDEVPVLKELSEVEGRISALADNVDLSEDVLARRAAALERKRDELIERLSTPGEGLVPVRLHRWVEQGFPGLFGAEERDFLREVIDRVVVRPAVVRGSKKFDSRRVRVEWGDAFR